MPRTVDEIFGLLFADDALLPIIEFHRYLGDTDFEMTKWEWNQELELYTRELKFICKLKGIPFKDKSRAYKACTYKKEGDALTLNYLTRAVIR